MKRQKSQTPQSIFDILHSHFGASHWWPADSPFEVVVGAILTQNTAWRNVEYAITNLKDAEALSLVAIANLTIDELENLIRPSGFFRQKAERLQLLCNYLINNYRGELSAIFQQPLGEVRAELLTLKGVGPETADSILLYAGGLPSFVVDTYTRRVFGRLGVLKGSESYEKVRRYFMDALPAEVELYNEYHALIVQTAKDYCVKKSPKCNNCPLLPVCPAVGI